MTSPSAASSSGHRSSSLNPRVLIILVLAVVAVTGLMASYFLSADSPENTSGPAPETTAETAEAAPKPHPEFGIVYGIPEFWWGLGATLRG